MAYIIWEGKLAEVDVFEKVISFVEYNCLAKDKSFSWSINSEEIYETIEDYNNKISIADKKKIP
jgi:hypothetical protein